MKALLRKLHRTPSSVFNKSRSDKRLTLVLEHNRTDEVQQFVLLQYYDFLARCGCLLLLHLSHVVLTFCERCVLRSACIITCSIAFSWPGTVRQCHFVLLVS